MINEFERMEQFAYDNDIKLLTDSLPDDLSGLCYLSTEYNLKTITLSTALRTEAEKTCVLAEEIEHYITTPLNLFTSSKQMQNKFERIARLNATKRLIPFDKLVEAHRRSIRCVYELADFLNVTFKFLYQGITLYSEYYSEGVVHKGFRISFNPLFIEPEMSV